MNNFTMAEKTNCELLSTLLDIPKENLQFHELSDILQAPRAIKGIGEKKENKLYALQEITHRLINAPSKTHDVIKGPEDVANVIMPKIRYESKEKFIAILLDIKNQIIAIETISIGNLNASLVHPREVFATALKYPTAALIVVHNHPSGIPTPSSEDINVTERLVKAGNIMNIPILDHIIIGDNKFVSFKDKGLLK
jgi:DNA repair protein RadC